MCAGAGKWCAQDRPRVVGRARAVGPAGRRARGGRAASSSFIAATTFALEAVLDLSPQLADAGTQRHPDRGGAGQALVERDGVADRRRAGPDPRRPRLRDRRLAGRPRRARGPGRADPARPADQPDLRGLVRDHAPADRPRGGRRAPRRRPATSPTPTPTCRRKAKAAAKASGFYAKWLPQLAVGKGTRPDVVRRVRRARQAPALRRAVVAQAGPADLLRHVAAGRRSSSTGRASSAGSSTSAPSCSRWRRPARGPRCSAADDPTQGDAAYELADAFCAAGAAAGRGAVRRAVGQHRRRRPVDRGQACSTASTPGSRTGVIDQSEGTGPVDRRVVGRAPASKPNVHRAYR